MKKHYLRKLLVLFMVFFAGIMITSCAKKETIDPAAFIGEWKLVVMEDKEEGLFTAEEFESLGLGETLFIINDDGNAVFLIAGEEINSTWEIKDSKTIIFDGGEDGKSTGVLEGDKLIFGDEEIRMEFEKK